MSDRLRLWVVSRRWFVGFIGHLGCGWSRQRCRGSAWYVYLLIGVYIREADHL
jgi:hypothetical protein